MKKLILLAMAFAFTCTTVFAQTPARPGKQDTTKTKKAAMEKVQYTCSMHPKVLSDKPGKCPKCGMALIKKTSTKKAGKMKM